MTSLLERRRYGRYFGRDLQVLGPGGVYPVRDISADGLSFLGKPFGLGDIVSITLTSPADQAARIDACCQVVALSTTVTHLTFAPVTIPLLTFIMQHIGAELGVAPYYFGKRQDLPAFV